MAANKEVVNLQATKGKARAVKPVKQTSVVSVKKIAAKRIAKRSFDPNWAREIKPPRGRNKAELKRLISAVVQVAHQRE